MTEKYPNKIQPNPGAGQQSRPVGGYNPGGQAGKSVQGGGQRPANDPGGPFLGKSATITTEPAEADTAGGKGKQDAKQTQKR
jgi:hypothetical protein